MAAGHAKAIRQPRLAGPVWSCCDGADPLGLAEGWRVDHPGAFAGLVDALLGVHVLVNAAGLADPQGSDEAALMVANAVLPAVLGLACQEAGVDRLVHLSSAAVQGRLVLSDLLHYAPLSAYARSKAAGEEVLLGFRPESGLRVVIYRAPSVISPGTSSAAALRRIGRLPFVPVTRPDAPVPTALLDNVAHFVHHLATIPDPPRVVAHPPEGMTVRSLIEAAGGSRPPRVVGLSGMDRAADRMFGAACRVERLAPRARRVELLVRGQALSARSLLGDLPPGFVGPEGYAALACDPERGGRRAAGLVRIAYLITRSDAIGGAQIHVLDLSAAMTSAGHDVRVLVGGEGPFTELLAERGVAFESITALRPEVSTRDLTALAEVRRALRSFGPDLVSAHSSKGGLLGRVAARSLKLPVVFTAHGWAFAEGVEERRRRVYTKLERAMAYFSSAIVCVSDADRRLAEAAGVGRGDRRHVVINGVRDVSPPWRADPGREPPHAVMVARLDDQKDHDTLLSALARLAHPLKMSLVGDGPRQSELRSRAAGLGLDHVEFLGYRADVHRVLAGAQMLVLVSHWEGLPRSIIEGMRAGLPVVASDVGGVGELVSNGQTGLLVERGDTDALAQALNRMAEDPGLRRAMGRSGRERFEVELSMTRLVDETVAIYEEVIGRPIRRPLDTAAFVVE